MSDFTRKWTDTIRKMPMRGSAMSDENVGGLPELPDSPFWNLQNEPFYTAEQMQAYARAALSAHGQPVVDAEMIERACAQFYGSDWLCDADEGFNPTVNELARSEMRDVLEAAINGEVPC